MGKFTRSFMAKVPTLGLRDVFRRTAERTKILNL
jgi:hypothetical protein